MRFGVNAGGDNRVKEGDLPEMPLGVLDILLHLLAFAGTVGIVVYVAMAYPQLPEYVPMHFGINGEADSWAARSSVWFLVATGVFCYVLTAGCSFFPKAFNMPVEITPENAPRLLTTIRTCLLFIAVQVVAMFGLVAMMGIRTAHDLPITMVNYSLWGLMALLLITTFGMVAYCFKAQ